jgi:hypothetical protein
MSLTRVERKERLGRGAAKEIAARVGKSRSHVHRVLAGERRDRKTEVAAARMARTSVPYLFPEFYPSKAG